MLLQVSGFHSVHLHPTYQTLFFVSLGGSRNETTTHPPRQSQSLLPSYIASFPGLQSPKGKVIEGLATRLLATYFWNHMQTLT